MVFSINLKLKYDRMKYIFRLLLIAGFTMIGIDMFAQTVTAPYEVGTWSGFRKTAINYTFDDGCPNQFNKAIPMFDEYDFKITLFTITGSVTNWRALQSAVANDHEVASHTITHPPVFRTFSGHPCNIL
jgi:peptidoglycan/xylan/chitin deacetylase (PgdA/CDA1 family)